MLTRGKAFWASSTQVLNNTQQYKNTLFVDVWYYAPAA
jgi:hypothetical protein